MNCAQEGVWIPARGGVYPFWGLSRFRLTLYVCRFLLVTPGEKSGWQDGQRVCWQN
jgi:hypothetical protein